jgi:hypothetical protein
MLHEFLTLNRQLLISRCREKVAKRFEPPETLATIDHGVPLFLQRLVETLRDEQNTDIRSIDEIVGSQFYGRNIDSDTDRCQSDVRCQSGILEMTRDDLPRRSAAATLCV